MNQTNKQNKQIETGFLISLKPIKKNFVLSENVYNDYEILNKLEDLK